VSKNPCRSPDGAHRSIGDEGGLVVLPAKAEVKVLNPVGTIVYGLLDGKHSVDEIVSAVVAEFEVKEEDARRDVEAFLEELDSEGLLARSQDSDTSQGG
jgi:hypothetical protein